MDGIFYTIIIENVISWSKGNGSLCIDLDTIATSPPLRFTVDHVEEIRSYVALKTSDVIQMFDKKLTLRKLTVVPVNTFTTVNVLKTYRVVGEGLL